MRHNCFDSNGRSLFAVRSDKFSSDRSGARRLLDSWPHHVVVLVGDQGYFAVTGHMFRKLVDSGVAYTVIDYLNAPVFCNGHWW